MFLHRLLISADRFPSSFYTALSGLSFKHPYSNNVPIWCQFVRNPLLTLHQKPPFFDMDVALHSTVLGVFGSAGTSAIFFTGFR